MKNESASNVFMEVSTNGLFGTWTRPGGSASFVRSGVEGPYAYVFCLPFFLESLSEGRTDKKIGIKIIPTLPRSF
jgi:hypothetical protein